MRTTLLLLAVLGTLLAAPSASAKPKDFQAGMTALLEPYLKIHAVFIEDKNDGVTEAAAKLEKLAGEVPAPKKGVKKARMLAKLPAKIAAAAATLKAAKGLKDQRAAYKKVSAPVVKWATTVWPAGLKVVHCDMEEADWVQRHDGVRNPYHGTSMLYCGQWVKPKPKKKGKKKK